MLYVNYVLNSAHNHEVGRGRGGTSLSINSRLPDFGIRFYQLYASACFIPVESNRVSDVFLAEWVKEFVKMFQVAGLV